MSKRGLLRSLGCALLVLGISDPALPGEAYQRTDAEGRRHFGDRPPPAGATAVPLPRNPANEAPTAGERLEKRRRLLQAFDEERRQQRDARVRAQQEKATRQRNCAEARDALRSQRSASGVYRLDDEGRRVFLDATERERSIEAARAAVDHWCGTS